MITKYNSMVSKKISDSIINFESTLVKFINIAIEFLFELFFLNYYLENAVTQNIFNSYDDFSKDKMKNIL